MPGTARDAIKLLESNGFQDKGQEGSHRKFFNPKTKRTAIVPMHKGDLKPGTWNSILKQAGLK